MNALVGEKVAFVDEEEATPLLCRYYCAGASKASKRYRDGTSEDWDTDALLSEMDANRSRSEWLDPIEYLEFGTANPMLRDVEFWDTPGLGGSEANRQIAEDFVTHVEAAIWVFDVDTIGRADIAGAMEVLAVREVPVVGVLNKAEDLDPADIDRAADFVRKVYPRIQFAEIVPLSARKALAHLGQGKVAQSFGTAVGADGGLQGLKDALERLILANPGQVNQDAAGRDLLAFLDSLADRLDASRIRLENAEALFEGVYGDVMDTVRTKYAEIREAIGNSYRAPLRAAISHSVERAVQAAKPEDFANAERFRRLRDIAANQDVSEPVLRRVSEGQVDNIHAAVTSFALDLESAIEQHLTPLEREEVRARWEKAGPDKDGSRMLGTQDSALAAAIGLKQWDLLTPRPQWEFVLGDVRPFRRPTRPPGRPATHGPNTEEPLVRDPKAIAERSAKAYMAEAEPILDDEIRLAVDRSCQFALNVFRERLVESLLEGAQPKDLETLLPRLGEIRGQIERWIDATLELAPPPRALPDALSRSLEFQGGKREALDEFWSAVVALPARWVEVRDPSFSHRTIGRLQAIDPTRPIRLRLRDEPLSGAMASTFQKALEDFRATRSGAVTVWVEVDDPTFAPSRDLVLGDHRLRFSIPISQALEGATPFRVEPSSNGAEPWRPQGSRLVAI